ncbi:hypothetical protein LguiA_017842 [Lonicera macranthoides]
MGCRKSGYQCTDPRKRWGAFVSILFRLLLEHIVSRVEVIEQVRVHLRVFSDAPTELVVVILDSRGIGILGTSLLGGEIKLAETYSDLSGILAMNSCIEFPTLYSMT